MGLFRKTKKEEDKPESRVKESRLGATLYQCPMKCEREKTYDQPGRCPVCKMYLQPVKQFTRAEGYPVLQYSYYKVG